MAARAATAHPRQRGVAAPRLPRRVSGPVRPRALPAPRTLPLTRVLDRLISSRACIWLIGLGLMGIVATQVSLLKMNAGISRAVETSMTLERQNAALEASIARLGSEERIRSEATRLGMISPPAGSVAYVTARGSDARRAARRAVPASDEARAVLAGETLTPSTAASGVAPPGTPVGQTQQTQQVQQVAPQTSTQTAAVSPVPQG